MWAKGDREGGGGRCGCRMIPEQGQEPEGVGHGKAQLGQVMGKPLMRSSIDWSWRQETAPRVWAEGGVGGELTESYTSWCS